MEAKCVELDALQREIDELESVIIDRKVSSSRLPDVTRQSVVSIDVDRWSIIPHH